MKKLSLVLPVVAVFLAGCQTTSIPAGASTAIIIACGLIDVVVEASVSEKISENFGPGTVPAKICELFAPSGAALPAAGSQPTVVVVTLPDGQSVSAIVRRVR